MSFIEKGKYYNLDMIISIGVIVNTLDITANFIFKDILPRFMQKSSKKLEAEIYVITEYSILLSSANLSK